MYSETCKIMWRPTFGTHKIALRGYSSVGRASALQAEGRRFESVYLHFANPLGSGILDHALENLIFSGAAKVTRWVGTLFTSG